ncbi:hypothetical protein VNI00_018403 [Paramarasmius palmivorus]|uniref:Uncharacterized protein n=1 Tax=Paramarasmius palmivorus TaxID=297713 RepID=A0AAW0AWW8_9AGAR
MSLTETTTAWVPPSFDLLKDPELVEKLEPIQDPQNFVRIAKWSAIQVSGRVDGFGSIRGFFLYDGEHRSSNTTTTEDDSQNAQLVLRQPSPIVDFLWYPTASSRDHSTFCFVSSVRESPVKLLDASNGRLRASYPIIDHRERFIAPHSLAFNLYGTRLYCGFEDAIEVFDVGQPGEGTRLPTTPSKKSKDGLKGIISALAFCPSYTSDYYAAGSLTPTDSNVALFSETQGEIPVMFLGGGPKAGVTQLQFNPMQPHMIYASFRRQNVICSWDMRGTVDMPITIYSLPQGSEEPTNQKRRFDVDISGHWLAFGSQSGNIHFFDLNTIATDGSIPTIEPALTYKAHDDSIGCVAFRPTSAELLSVSGSRNYPSSDSEEDEDDEVVPNRSRKPVTRDRSIKLWHL